MKETEKNIEVLFIDVVEKKLFLVKGHKKINICLFHEKLHVFFRVLQKVTRWNIFFVLQSRIKVNRIQKFKEERVDIITEAFTHPPQIDKFIN